MLSAQLRLWPTCRHQLSHQLWVRARRAGAWTETDRRGFGFADDVAAAGWLLLDFIFSSLAWPGSADGATLRRLYTTTLGQSWAAFRDYAGEEEAWAEALQMLDEDGGAGWELAAAMLHTDWRARPDAVACLTYKFLRSPQAAGLQQ